jgi:small subunit ribosomal protein S1
MPPQRSALVALLIPRPHHLLNVNDLRVMSDPTSTDSAPVPTPAPAPVPDSDAPGVPAAPPASSNPDPTQQTFRANTDAALDAEVEAALGGTDVDAMLDQSVNQSNTSTALLKGTQAGVVSRVDLGKGEILVELDGKHQALVPAKAYQDAGNVPSEGEFLEVDIETYDANEGIYRAHKKGSARKVTGWDELKVGQVVEAIVTGVNKGGLECRVGQTAIRAFMPSGQLDVVFHKDISTFLNEKINAKITKLDKSARNLVLSRRAVVEAERREARDKTMQTLEEGATLKGTVKSVKDFGAFVDLGGVDGLLHVTQLTHKRMANAADYIKAGDEVEVRVDSIQKGGKGGGKIALSLSHRPPDPWEQAETKYAVGSAVTGRVTRVENFGCFVELEEGIEALLPASEMSWRRIRHPSEVTNVGEQLRCMVIQIDPKARKLTLSLKQAEGDPWSQAAGKYEANSTHPGKVTRVADFGAFVELEPGVEGLIHISELSNNRVRRTEDVVKLGQTVNARVLEVDTEKRRLRLSLKEHDPQAEAKMLADLEKRQSQKKDRQKRLSKAPLRGGLDF